MAAAAARGLSGTAAPRRRFSMPPKARIMMLISGNEASLACYSFGDAHARAQAAPSVPRAVWSSEARCEGVGREKPQVGRVMVDFRGGEEPRCDTRIPIYVHA